MKKIILPALCTVLFSFSAFAQTEVQQLPPAKARKASDNAAGIRKTASKPDNATRVERKEVSSELQPAANPNNAQQNQSSPAEVKVMREKVKQVPADANLER